MKNKETKVKKENKKIKEIKEKKPKKEKIVKVKENKPKKKKPIKKNFIDDGMHWESNKIILRVILDDNKYKDYIRTFISGVTISINKDKIGKKTKYDGDKWGNIIDIIDEEKDLIFILEPTA